MTSTVPPSPPATPIRVSDPADLVAAVPVLLGFRPRESLVLVSLGGRSGRRIGLTLRVDLPPPEHSRAVAEHAVASLFVDDPDGAAVIVVAESGGGPVRRDVATAAVEALEGGGVQLRAAVWAERVEAGARWECFGSCRCSGALPDPGATPAAAAAAATGQPVHADRAGLEQLVEPTDPVRVRRREESLLRVADGALRGPDPGAGEIADSVHLAVVETAVSDTAAGSLVLDDGRVLDLAAALVRRTVRDAVLVRCAQSGCTQSGATLDGVAPREGRSAGWSAAETLWAALCRELPDPEAAEAAALLAATALLRGDGALANVALDRAERSRPGHRLAGLLRSAAAVPMRPSQIRECILGSGRLG